MKVILINPAYNRYGGVKGHGGSVIPLNLCCLAAYIRKLHNDVELKILDSESRDISHEETFVMLSVNSMTSQSTDKIS